MRCYARFLEPLVRSKPCYELTTMDHHSMNDWSEIFTRYLPEQGPPSEQAVEALPKNDTLLVLANPPAQRNVSDHFTPARWWGGVMESCMKQKGLHMYGSVRILVSVPPTDAEDILPRSAIERRRPGIMTENVALHAWEVAQAYNHEQWKNLKQLELLESIKRRVAERAAAQNVTTPTGREPPPITLAPHDSRKKTKAIYAPPYLPRPGTEWHEKLTKTIERGSEVGQDKSAMAKKAKNEKSVALQQLRRDNTNASLRCDITKSQANIEERTQNLSRAAADPRRTAEELAVLDRSLADLKANFANMISEQHWRNIRGYDREIDDWCIAKRSNNFDHSAMLWERRPFEPMRSEVEEHYPREPRTMIYFEANADAPAVRKLKEIPAAKRDLLMQLFDVMPLVLSTRNNISVKEIAQALFHDRSANDIVKSVPSLAGFAGKQLKPGCGVVPLDDPTLDAHECFQENIDYDLSEVRLRCLPVTVMWEILLDSQKHFVDLSATQFSRLLGSTMTTSRGVAAIEKLKLR